MAFASVIFNALPTWEQITGRVVQPCIRLWRSPIPSRCDVMNVLIKLGLKVILQLMLLAPVLLYSLGFLWRKLRSKLNYNTVGRWLLPRVSAWTGMRELHSINLSIALVSGRVLDIECCSSWSIRDVKEQVGRSEGISRFQMRIFAGCEELLDDKLLGCGVSSQLTLILRRPEIAQWLEQVSQGTSCKLQDASDEVRASKECVLAAVHGNPFDALKYSQGFCDDKDVVMAAVQSDGFAILCASSRLRADFDVALAAVGRDRQSLSAMMEPLRSDEAFLRRAYWVTSLDCRDERFNLDAIGLAEGWEEVLYKRQGFFEKQVWAFLHDEMRKGSLSMNMLMTVAWLIGALIYYLLAQYSWIIKLNVVGMFMQAVAALLMLLDPVMDEMHVEIVKSIAEPLSIPRRSCCRCGNCDSCK